MDNAVRCGAVRCGALRCGALRTHPTDTTDTKSALHSRGKNSL